MAYQGNLNDRIGGTMLVFFLSLIVGLTLAIVFPQLRFVSLENKALLQLLHFFGALLLVGGTGLAYVAQRLWSPLFRSDTDSSCFDLYVGPYKYFRHPVYLGLIMLFFGLSAIMNALPIAIVTVITAIATHFTLIRREERIMRGECGPAYDDYIEKMRTRKERRKASMLAKEERMDLQ